MIRSLKLVCSRCGAAFKAEGVVYYADDFSGTTNGELNLLCPQCIAKWRERWQIKNAVFHEQDYVMTVDIELVNGESFKKMDCTPLEESQTVILAEDIPLEAQQQLYIFYAQWDQARKAKLLKDLTFQDEFMRMTFSCETYDGEKYENIAFRFNMQGEMQTEKAIPDYIKEQIIAAYQLYEKQGSEAR